MRITLSRTDLMFCSTCGEENNLLRGKATGEREILATFPLQSSEGKGFEAESMQASVFYTRRGCVALHEVDAVAVHQLTVKHS
jgi:hypothetical protein